MQLSVMDQEILKTSYAHLHEAIGNITCLNNFISRYYPEHKDIEYTLYIHAIHRAKEIEAIMETPIPYPVFGKELDMGDKERLFSMIKTTLGINRVGYLDAFGDCTGTCVNEALRLYEIAI